MFKEAFNLLNSILGKDMTDDSQVSKAAQLIKEFGDPTHRYDTKLKDVEIGQEVLKASSEEQLQIILELLVWLTNYERELKEKRQKNESTSYNYSGWNIKTITVELLRKKLPFNEDNLITLIDWSLSYASNYWRCIPQVIKQIQDFEKNQKLTPALIEKIKTYVEVISNDSYNDAQLRQQVSKLRDLVETEKRIPLVSGEAWSDAAISSLNSFDKNKKSNWIDLLNHCAVAKGSAPSAKWLKAADEMIEGIGWENYKKAVLQWFPLVDKPRTVRIETWSQWSPDPNLLINDANADILKGMVWLCTIHDNHEIFRALATLAISAYRKVPQIGQRCVRVGNACVWALGEMKDSAAVGQLAVLKVRVKFGTAQKLIETALEKAAERSNLPKDEIEEMSIPDYGLQEVGKLTEKVGDYTAEVSIKGTDEVELQWFSPEGKPLKVAPAAIKKDYADDVKELNQTLKDIRQMLPAQRNRIDYLYLEQKKWSFDVWKERYLDHPLVGTIVRRLIWKFTDQDGSSDSGIWYDGKIVTAYKNEIESLDENTTVELWHPIDEPVETVLDWRTFLEENMISQPFKQAHREIYLLTDAERNTGTYSNRYAAHILKQHQFNALCSARGWKNNLRLMVDDSYTPAMRFLSNWNIRAEFWIEGAGDEYGTDTNEAGTYLYLSTDQVRFYPIDARENHAHASGGGYGRGFWGAGTIAESIELEKIPSLVFSEIMRDVDLFVGVASIGNDPNWLDTGVEGNRLDYWRHYSFGELSVSAKMRKQMLEKIIPRLKIAERCTFDDKFLIVRGDIRSYKIHLGSGNILMMPNDQYLCIVASPGKMGSGKVFLPFEGDQRTAIILSKAFMLAEDTKIQDQTIIRQISRN